MRRSPPTNIHGVKVGKLSAIGVTIIQPINPSATAHSFQLSGNFPYMIASSSPSKAGPQDVPSMGLRRAR